MSVTRYDVNGPSSVFEDVNGSLVDFKDYAALEAKRAALAAELKQSKIDADCYKKGMEASNARLVQLAAENAHMQQVIGDVQTLYYESDGIVGYHLNGDIAKWDDVMPDLWAETPATDAFLAEVRDSAILEGYALVPQQIFLEPSDIESICSQCGDGHESGYGDFTDGLLWVGSIKRDDGSIVHGMHISSADYSEEGGVTVCEFAAQLRKGDAQ